MVFCFISFGFSPPDVNVFFFTKSQLSKKYSAKETAAIITGAGMPDNVMTKLRTVSNKTFGYSHYASHKKVVAARENILPFSR